MALCLEQSELKIDNFADGFSATTPKQPSNTFFYGLDLKQDRLFHVSDAIKDVLGYSPREVMRNGLKWFVEQIHPEDLKHLNHIADRQPHSPIIPQIHYRFKNKNGTLCLLYEHRCLLYNPNGKPSFIIGRIEKSGKR